MQQLAVERAQTEVERARTEKAIAAFAALAERLEGFARAAPDALAEERRRPWGRRLAVRSGQYFLTSMSRTGTQSHDDKRSR